MQQYISLCQDVSEIILSAIKKTNHYYLEEEKTYGITYTPEATLLEDINEVLVQAEFNICLHPVTARSPKIWERMEALCERFASGKSTKESLTHIWQVTVVNLTNAFIEALIQISDEESEILKDPLIAPFEGLSMKYEYVLQVLVNAFASRNGPKYEKLMQTSLYTSFDIWFKLLLLFEVPIESEYSKYLYDYIQSTFPFKGVAVDKVITKLTYSDRNLGAKKIPTQFCPPNATLLVTLLEIN